MILLVIFAPAMQAQQSVTLEQAIETAMTNHPRLKMAESEIERARVSKGKHGMEEILLSVIPGDS